MLASTFLLCLLGAAEPPVLTLTGDTSLYDGKRKIANADGHAKLRGADLAVDADRMVYDQGHDAVTAVGHVVARIAQGGLMVVLADVVTLRLDQDQVREVYLLDGHGIAKKDTTVAALLAADTEQAARAVGKTQALLDGNRLTRTGNAWTSAHATLVPCECNFDQPSWSIEATEATIDTDADRVAVVMPVVRVKHVPILWLPWLSLPMKDRQTGLLFTRPAYSGLNGFSLEQPVFVTLGRSADLTLTPGYFFGSPHEDAYGIAGPRLQTEFRYALSPRAWGRANLGLTYDLHHVRDPYAPAGPDPTQPLPPVRGLRGEFAWAHTQDFDLGFGARVDVNAYSDGYYNRDLTTDVLAAAAGFLHSAAAVFQRGPDHLVNLEVALRQDLNAGYTWWGTNPLWKANGATSTSPQFGPGTLQRWPALTASLPYHPLVGPLAVDVTAEAVRLAPLFSKTGDEGVGAFEGDGGYGATELSATCLASRLFGTSGSPSPSCAVDRTGQGDRVWQPGEREARDRFMLFPRVHLAGSLFDVVGLSAWAGWRQSAWLGEASGRSWQRGTLVLDARAETELSRRFGDFRHSVQLLVASRAVPFTLRGASDPSAAEVVPYDDVDAAVPRGGGLRAQLAVELRNRLWGPKGLALQLDVGQGVDLAAPERTHPGWNETYGRFTFALPPFTSSFSARVDPVQGRVTRLQASCALDTGKGSGLGVAYDNVLDDGTARTRAPIDLLFGVPVPAAYTDRAQSLAAWGRYNFGPIALRYDLQLLNAPWWNPGTSANDTAFSFAQHVVTLSLTPACDCWRVDLYAVQRLVPRTPTRDAPWPLPISAPDFGATITVNRFGSIGTK